MEDPGLLRFRISYRGRIYEMKRLGSDTLGALAEHLKDSTDASPDTIKLVLPKGRRNPAGRSIPRAVQLTDVEWRGLLLGEVGITSGMTVLMSGASSAEVAAVSEPSASGIADFDYEEKRARQRARRTRVPLALPTGPYVFADFRTLQLPGVTLHPPEAKALKLMHRLASDPGIVAIMNKYKWRVGIMTELAPEGYVGVSPVCLLGFNRNRGMEISLRLRTDDLAGFRKYDSIRQTLLHELTHMVHDDHDQKFKALNSQLKREAEELDWTRKTGHTLGGGPGIESDDESESTDEEVGRVLGGGGRTTPAMDPRAAAAAAALRRDEEKRRREAEGRPTADVADDVIMDEAGGSGASVDAGSTSPGSLSGVERSSAKVEDGGKRGAVPQKEGKEVRARGKQKVEESADRPEWGSIGRANGFEDHPRDEPKAGLGWAEGGARSEGLDMVPGRTEDGPQISGSHVVVNGSPLRGEPDPDIDPEDSASPAASGQAEDVTGIGAINPSEQDSVPVSDAHRSEAMNVDGSPEERPEAARTEPTSRGNDAEMTGGSGVEETGGSDGGGDDEWRRAQAAAAEASGRVQKAVAELKRQAGPGEVSLTLKTLATILRNVMEHPTDAKYRRVRKTNAAFFERVGKFQAAMEVLQAAGFREDSASDAMVLQRDDPGLIWLTCSLVEGSLA